MITSTNWNRRILVIDDNRAIHADIRKILSSPGVQEAALDRMAALFGDEPVSLQGEAFEIDSAYQGQEGIDLVGQSVQQGRPYAMAFVDVRMPPGLDGVETAAQIWAVDPYVQIVICTAYSDYSWEQTASRLPLLNRWLIQKKPFDNIEIRQLAQSLTEKWALVKLSESRVEDLEHLVAERTGALEEANRQIRREMADRERMEVELRHAQKLESVGQLAAGIAHEINTPIQFIGDSVHFLRESFADLRGLLSIYQTHCTARGALPAVLSQAEQDKDLAYLEEQVPLAFDRTIEGIERVATIVRAMKEFAHPAQKEQGPADLNRALQSTLTVARNEYKYVAEIETRFDDLPPLMCHVEDLNQVFLNLIVNASHAIQDAQKQRPDLGLGRIRLETRRDGADVVVSIADTGCGIPAAIKERVFDPFFTTKEVGRGTGQGLAIARSIIVNQHGGSLTYETTVGQGTTFFIRLPVGGRIDLPADAAQQEQGAGA